MQKLIKKIPIFVWILAAATVALFVVIRIYIANENRVAMQRFSTERDTSLIVRSVTQKDHVIGDIDAPIQLIVYSDFSCPYCKRLFGEHIPKLQKEYKGQFVVAFRHFPLPSKSWTTTEAAASECVYQLGGDSAFWKFADYMFERNGVKGETEGLKKAAMYSGVGADAYGTCMKEGKGVERVEQDRVEASIAGVTMTPTEVLKSEHRALMIKGDYYSQLRAGIQYLLDVNQQIESRN